MTQRGPKEPVTANVSNPARRALLRALTAGTGAVVAGAVLPKSWTKPIVDSIILPLHAQTSAVGSSQLFTASGSFTVPAGVTSLRVLAVGGGAGGGGGHQGGGGSGRVAFDTVTVTPGDSITVTIGAGGAGAPQANDNSQFAGTPGGTTSFGALLSATGGSVVTGMNGAGNDGGSGGGSACNAGSPGGAGGTGGGNGGACQNSGGLGQGDYSALLANFTLSSVTAGAGGAGGTMTHAGAGGGGGILVDAAGPTAGAGEAGATSGQGGVGYDAGAGSGGYDEPTAPIRFAGGAGADGLVYIEW